MWCSASSSTFSLKCKKLGEGLGALRVLRVWRVLRGVRVLREVREWREVRELRELRELRWWRDRGRRRNERGAAFP